MATSKTKNRPSARRKKATPPRKKATSSGKKKATTTLVSSQRKREILGVILMALAALLSLALATYNPADDDIARNVSLDALFAPDGNQAGNALGLVGAVLAWLLVPNFLGYTTLLLTGLLFAWGYVVFRHRKTVYLPFVSMLTLAGAVVLATLLGWIGMTTGQDWSTWSGLIGQGLAEWMRQVFGALGSFMILALLVIVTLLLVIDRDIQRSLDRVEDWFQKAVAWLKAWRADHKERQGERRDERTRLRKERKAERARERQEQKREERQKYVRPTREPGIEASDAAPPSRRQAPAPPLPVEKPEAAAPAPTNGFRQPTPAPAPPKPPAPVEEPADLELKVFGQVEEEKADEIAHVAAVADETLPYEFPSIDLLDTPDEDEHHIDYEELEENKAILLDKLATYNIEITNINAIVGPTVTLYELTPAPGIKISRITALENDMAMAMAARGIRMIAPIPGKSAIGVEIPNRHRELVRIRDVIGTAKFRDAEMELPVALGKTIEGEVFLQDLAKMPHLLIAGATGSGKSVGLNTLIAGLLYACHPSNLKFVMIDPKKIELQQYREVLDHYLALPEDGEDAIITDVADALGVLKGCMKEMEQRYDLLSDAKVRGIKDYNRKLREGKLDLKKGHHHLPYIVVIVDELADLMMTAGKDIEAPIARLAQMARAVGIHLVLATQRPSVDVITGLIKANFPSRVAYQVASKIDARTILDQNGAEGLVGNGDMLYMSGSKILRLQGPFVSVDEVDRLMEFIADQPGAGPYILPPIEDRDAPTVGGAADTDDGDMDDLFEEAARIIVRSQQGSVSLLQRKLSIGYTRAARIVDQLEEAGVVGAFVGSKAREVLVADELELDQFLKARAVG